MTGIMSWKPKKLKLTISKNNLNKNDFTIQKGNMEVRE